MGATSVLSVPVRRLIGRDDFRRNPLKALVKRIFWRLRWLANSSPVQLRHSAGFSIAAPKGAAGALIYYLGRSEPETAEFITRSLRPGMVFFDVGAHIGEYTLMAAALSGEHGRVHAFEAQPATAELLRRNCQMNNVRNAVINSCAVSDCEGTLEFEVCSEPSMSCLAVAPAGSARHSRMIRVPSITLDVYCERQDVRPDLLKIDVEGAEWLVLQGAARILRGPASAAPIVLFECLDSTYNRFGCTTDTVTDFLRTLGYELYRITGSGTIIPFPARVPDGRGYNIVALKC